jgi:hypothetical protein
MGQERQLPSRMEANDDILPIKGPLILVYSTFGEANYSMPKLQSAEPCLEFFIN